MTTSMQQEAQVVGAVSGQIPVVEEPHPDHRSDFAATEVMKRMALSKLDGVELGGSPRRRP